MTKQEAFDEVVRHLVKQGKQAVDGTEICCYRYEGRKCAIGALLPDHLYREEMENRTASALIDGYSDVAEHFAGLGHFFLTALQGLHDHSCNWLNGFKLSAAAEFAAWHGLSDAVVDELKAKEEQAKALSRGHREF